MPDVLSNINGGLTIALVIPSDQADLKVGRTYQSYYDSPSNVPNWLPAATTSSPTGFVYTLVRTGNLIDGSIRDDLKISNRSQNQEAVYSRTMGALATTFTDWIITSIDIERLTSLFMMKNTPNTTNQNIVFDNQNWDTPGVVYHQPDGTDIISDTFNGAYRIAHTVNGQYFLADSSAAKAREFHTSTQNFKYGNLTTANLYAGNASQWYTLIDVPGTNYPWAIDGYFSIPAQHFLARIRFAGSVRSIGPSTDIEILGCYSYWNYYPTQWRIRVEPVNGRCSLDFRFVGTLAANVNVRFDTINKLVVGAEAIVKLAAAGTWSSAGSAGIEILTVSEGLKWRRAIHQIGYGNFTLLSLTGAWTTLTEASSYGA